MNLHGSAFKIMLEYVALKKNVYIEFFFFFCLFFFSLSLSLFSKKNYLGETKQNTFLFCFFILLIWAPRIAFNSVIYIYIQYILFDTMSFYLELFKLSSLLCIPFILLAPSFLRHLYSEKRIRVKFPNLSDTIS